MENELKAAEYGAIALAVLLMYQLAGFGSFQESGIGTGIDFWIETKQVDELPFQNKSKARLEISGILKETSSNTLQARIRLKEEQVKSSDLTQLPVYILFYTRPL